ncbi:class I SAM-dependent methyltransferase [Rhizobium sp. RM]|uniref:class I SAM-dependent methyltransferase n=1 Tax=Rhizobium sp. RM TaxID=2748079 RepID=UPI00110E67FF|nr:class I SAM-dependent methyltransferase [Rhizobium sp. RM]NWJ27275.1 class I SAM-dependent methyltransferase [Rhizobium sp. RM]TMV20335.1 class I SAM-dependent methyltransferase [Rhizobium sp. Td3]
MVELKWYDGNRNEAKQCLACGTTTEMPLIVSTTHVIEQRGDVLFYRCPVCSSLNAEGQFADFLTSDEGFIDSDRNKYVWDHYLEIGAGIDFMVRPIERAGIITKGRLLDVGCGYGFPLDYWQFVANGVAVGLEPSEYGARGARELNVKIIPEYLSDQTELVGQKFDRIISSEVIEHVPDPKAFLEGIKTYLDQNGVAILTTPNADFITRHGPLSTLIAALSPGLHQLLFSKLALEKLLQDVGFSHYVVDVHEERLIAYASNEPISFENDDAEIRANYLKYLQSKAVTTDPLDALGAGIRYRLFKELVNEGRFDEALPIGKEIASSIATKYQFDPLSPAETLAKIRACDTMQDYTKAAPFFLPCFVFYAAMLTRHGRELGSFTASDQFSCAADLCAHAQRHNVIFSQEAGTLYWVSVFEEAFARLVDGDKERAYQLMERIRNGSEPDERYLETCARPRSLVLRATLQSGIAKLQSGEPEWAMAIFRKLMRDIEGDEEAFALFSEAKSAWETAVEQSREMLPSQNEKVKNPDKKFRKDGLLTSLFKNKRAV